MGVTYQFDRVAEAFEALHQPPFNALLVTLIEVIRSELPVRLTPRQHMIRNHQDRMTDRHRRLLLPATSCSSPVLSADVGLLAPSCPMCCFHQCLPKPGAPFACSTTQPLACTFVIAWTHSSPRGKMVGAREALQIASNLCAEYFCRSPTHAWNAVKHLQAWDYVIIGLSLFFILAILLHFLKRIPTRNPFITQNTRKTGSKYIIDTSSKTIHTNKCNRLENIPTNQLIELSTLNLVQEYNKCPYCHSKEDTIEKTL